MNGNHHYTPGWKEERIWRGGAWDANGTFWGTDQFAELYTNHQGREFQVWTINRKIATPWEIEAFDLDFRFPADQDEIWTPDKIHRHERTMKKVNALRQRLRRIRESRES